MLICLEAFLSAAETAALGFCCWKQTLLSYECW